MSHLLEFLVYMIIGLVRETYALTLKRYKRYCEWRERKAEIKRLLDELGVSASEERKKAIFDRLQELGYYD